MVEEPIYRGLILPPSIGGVPVDWAALLGTATGVSFAQFPNFLIFVGAGAVFLVLRFVADRDRDLLNVAMIWLSHCALSCVVTTRLDWGGATYEPFSHWAKDDGE